VEGVQVGKTERERDMLEREREMMSVPGTVRTVQIISPHRT
jgi:hypothetical protein